MDDYLAFAKDLVRQGGQLIKDNFDRNVSIEFKSDNTPVTWVDKQINDLIIEAVKSTYPDHGLLGEESNLGSGDEELQWLCDPLDGTKCFILGVPQCTCVLALTKQGQILMSTIYNPFNGRLYHAIKGQGAFCNDQPIHANNQPLKGGYVISEETGYKTYHPIVSAGAQLEVAAGAGYRAMILASGRCSAIVQGKADNHDIGPCSLIVEEAGGRVTDFDGSPLRYDRSIKGGVVLSNGICHDEVLKIVQQHQ